MTEAERRAALEEVAAEVRACRRCRLHEQRTNAVPGEGHPSTEVLFVGEGPGLNEDRQGRPFVGPAGALLDELLASVGWRREEVFITNVVKCRPPGNRDPEPDEIAACAPFLRRQVEILDPALVVTLGRHSMARFMPGAKIGSAHGTARPAPPETGARNALVFAMYHPAAALHQASLRPILETDMLRIPNALIEARRWRLAGSEVSPGAAAPSPPEPAVTTAAAPRGPATSPMTTPAAAAPSTGERVEETTGEITGGAAEAGGTADRTPTESEAATPASASQTPGLPIEPDRDQLTLFSVP